MSYTYKGTFSTTIGNELISVTDFSVDSVTDDEGNDIIGSVLLYSITEADEAGIYNVAVSSSVLHEYINVNVDSPTSAEFPEVQVKCTLVVSDLISMITTGVWAAPVRTLTSYGESVLPPDAIPVPSSESEALFLDQDYLSKQNAMPLELFRMVLQYHPYHFWQLANADIPVTSACNDAIYEYSYMHADRIGRSEIREAISMAEKLITPHLGYSPYRHYVEEIVEFPYQNPAHVPTYFRIEGREGKVIAPGVETLGLILSNVTPTFSCEYNSNGVYDTFTIVLAPTENYDEDEIAIYVNETYHVRKFNNLADYKIAPIIVNVDDTTNVITITGSIWLLVKPELYEGISHVTIDPSDTDNFVDSIDVYRNYTSSGASYDAAEAILIWDDNPGLNRFCQTNGKITYAYGKLGVRDAHLGVFSIGEAVWDTDSSDWVTYNGWLSAIGMPDRAILRYRAGAEETTDFVKMISVMTAAELTRPICACDSANRWLSYWQADHSRVDQEADGVFRVTMRDMENPFGTRRGHIETWKKIKAKMNFGGIAI